MAFQKRQRPNQSASVSTLELILTGDEVREVNLGQLQPDPESPRNNAPDPQSVDRMVKSIRDHGIIEPIPVVSLGNDRFQLRGGYTRFVAATMLHSASAHTGIVPIRVIHDEARALNVRQLGDMIRTSLSPMQVADWLQQRAGQNPPRGWASNLAERLGFARSWVSNHTRLLKIDPELQHLGRINVIRDQKVLVGADKLPPKALKKFLKLVREDKREPRVALNQAKPKQARSTPPTVSVPQDILADLATVVGIDDADSMSQRELIAALLHWRSTRTS